MPAFTPLLAFNLVHDARYADTARAAVRLLDSKAEPVDHVAFNAAVASLLRALNGACRDAGRCAQLRADWGRDERPSFAMAAEAPAITNAQADIAVEPGERVTREDVVAALRRARWEHSWNVFGTHEPPS